MTEQEVETLAGDLFRGLAFCSVQVTEVNLLGLVFLPLGLGANVPEDTGMAYEYMHKALPRGVNRYPSFASMRLVTIEDTKAVLKRVQELQLAGVK